MNQTVISLFSAALICMILQELFCQKGTSRIIFFACGLLMIFSLFNLLHFRDFRADIEEIMREYNKSAVEQRDNIISSNKELLKDIIEEECIAYILDKSQKHGFSPKKVRVKISDNADCPEPYSTTIHGNFTIQQKVNISGEIAMELGIPKKDQEWIWSQG